MGTTSLKGKLAISFKFSIYLIFEPAILPLKLPIYSHTCTKSMFAAAFLCDHKKKNPKTPKHSSIG